MHIFSTSDSSNQDVLLLSKVRNLEVSGADQALIGSEKSADWEWIRSGSPPTHVTSLSQSEAQKFRVNPLLIPSQSPPDPLLIPSRSAPD